MNKSDSELEDMINFWLDHYTKNGDSHYSDTSVKEKEDFLKSNLKLKKITVEKIKN